MSGNITIIGYEKIVSKMRGTLIAPIKIHAEDVADACNIVATICGQAIKGVHSAGTTSETDADGNVTITVHYTKTE